MDPFAGGGSIPLEAQRLGLEAHASDLNPLPVILNKALIDFPARFHGQASVNPESEVSAVDRAEGMADDIRYYGKLLRDKAFEKVGNLYPKVKDDNGDEHTVIAWIWARTVTNPNPANPVQVPLVRSWWLSKKKGHEAWIKPIVENGTIRYEVQHNADGPKGDAEWTIKNGKGGKSIVDGTPFTYDYVRQEGEAGRLGTVLIGVVADGNRGRLYCSPDEVQIAAAEIPRIEDAGIDVPIAENPRWFSPPQYGMHTFEDLFTNRQLTVLTTLADTVAEVREQVIEDALAKGLPQGDPLDDGGTGAQAYADAISVYLSLAVSRQTDYSSSICSWHNGRDTIRNVFSRQAMPMTWDFAETNPFSSSTGNYLGQVNWVAEAIQNVPSFPQGEAIQADAAARDYTDMVVSTDPPYYDNIGYSDLSDYFYVWLRRMLKNVLPSTVRTMLTTKAQELVANPYRHGGKDGAAEFFVDGFNHVFAHIRNGTNPDVPMTVYYAYKQKDDKSGTSTGWYALLDGLIKAGWEITATWPMRTEMSNKIAHQANMLASSIVLACRPRPEDAPSVAMRIFNSILRSELTEELRTLMVSGIDPVDLSQAAIGPGISVYSRYARIREADGSDMPVQKALEIINRTVDEVMGDADSDYDPDTRFAVKWYQSYGWDQETAGMADQLSRSCGTSPDALVRGGMFEAAGGKARLLTPQELSGEWKPLQDDRVSLWEACIRMAGILDAKGVDAVAPVMAQAGERLPLDQIRALGFRMYHEAEKRKDTEGAIRFNNLVSMWDDLSLKAVKEAANIQESVQGELDVD
ncbi:DUF1156 domain-containing protein [Bifidobacterium callimiconis]|uniref:DUF1156 domain-containing protein n=1 Tax=Bifidobacterium callimiconis TaxID=2306973 RepID=UPI001F0B17DE|nr:hypothetical protein [Bifidobacterium callimiconis]